MVCKIWKTLYKKVCSLIKYFNFQIIKNVRLTSSSIRWFERSVPWCYKRRPWMRNQWMSNQWMHTNNECVINECVIHECIIHECVINGCIINECIINEWVINEEKKSKLLKYTMPIIFAFQFCWACVTEPPTWSLYTSYGVVVRVVVILLLTCNSFMLQWGEVTWVIWAMTIHL